MDEIDKDTVISMARVFNTIKNNEADSDHVDIVNSALDKIWEGYEGDIINVNADNVCEKDVKITFEFLEKNSPSREEQMNYRANNDGERHPDRILSHIFEFVDLGSRYVNGCLPSFRDWEVTYICNGEVIEERVYDYDDEIPTSPIIDGVRYECKRTNRGNGDVEVFISKNPIREDVDIVINAKGNDFINLETHDGPNIQDRNVPINVLSDKFNWGMLGDTEIIINGNPDEVINFIESKGWEYEFEQNR